MSSNLLNILQILNVEELTGLRSMIEDIIKDKYRQELGKRKNKRVEMELISACEVEREKEFFGREHQITILDISVGGLRFQSAEPLLQNDLVEVFFRSPTNGAQKQIDCQVIRVKEVKCNLTVEYHIAAKGVGKEYVRKYKDWLSKRALYLGS